MAGLGALVAGPALLIHGGPAQQPVDIAYTAFDIELLRAKKFSTKVYMPNEVLRDMGLNVDYSPFPEED